mgnify:FL=1|jgi:hypothetical protein
MIIEPFIGERSRSFHSNDLTIIATTPYNAAKKFYILSNKEKSLIVMNDDEYEYEFNCSMKLLNEPIREHTHMIYVKKHKVRKI